MSLSTPSAVPLPKPARVPLSTRPVTATDSGPFLSRAGAGGARRDLSSGPRALRRRVARPPQRPRRPARALFIEINGVRTHRFCSRFLLVHKCHRPGEDGAPRGRFRCCPFAPPLVLSGRDGPGRPLRRAPASFDDIGSRDLIEISSNEHPKNEDVRTKKRKYDESYISFGVVDSNGSPLCMLCSKLLSNSSMTPAKLRQYLETVHSESKDKNKDFFTVRMRHARDVADIRIHIRNCGASAWIWTSAFASVTALIFVDVIADTDVATLGRDNKEIGCGWRVARTVNTC
ncbi:Zinc finger BED domain-containing protein 5 [Eumeta japonica]|uniref:Zinc finger BED domain-containing protein 5 n=1 Tax=Eumeta variegata TaxID=151549 RepID=A0A4C1WSJ2_EUMVA|nr:Zinc finger BED domain-containing protein 5 [Eumeta japonica]